MGQPQGTYTILSTWGARLWGEPGRTQHKQAPNFSLSGEGEGQTPSLSPWSGPCLTCSERRRGSPYLAGDSGPEAGPEENWEEGHPSLAQPPRTLAVVGKVGGKAGLQQGTQQETVGNVGCSVFLLLGSLHLCSELRRLGGHFCEMEQVSSAEPGGRQGVGGNRTSSACRRDQPSMDTTPGRAAQGFCP